jgi:hypothetical protein
VQRTVSFSDKRVADVVNSKFVAAWTNRGPGFQNAEFWTEKGIAQQNYEMYPTKNICTFFLTPDRKVYYYAAGSYSPEIFLKILETASTLRKTMFDEQMRLTEKGLSLGTKLHEEQAEVYQVFKEDAERPDGWKSLVKAIQPGLYRGMPHVHSAACGWSLKNGYDYLATLHRHWANQKALPAFDDVRYQYQYGNDFSEETADSRHVSRPDAPPAPKPVAPRLRALETQPKVSTDLFGVNMTGIRLYGQ